MKAKRIFNAGIGLIMGFVLFTILVQAVDVQYAGVNNSAIGFATVNLWFHKLTGVNLKLYTVTDRFSVVPFGVCTLFGAVGAYQLIKRKSIFKVDSDIVALGIYYVMVIICYCCFEIFPINYRPILIGGAMEASYPSSTTLLIMSVMPTLIVQSEKRLKTRNIKNIIDTVTIAFTLFMITARLLSGVHWLTDIIGGLLLSAGLLCMYISAVSKIEQEDF